jgi:hypothetical protein
VRAPQLDLHAKIVIVLAIRVNPSAAQSGIFSTQI